jgi:hypothetical protein
VTTAVIYAVAGLGNAILAFFLMRGKRWARVVTMVLCGIGVFFAVGSFFTGGGLANCVGIGLNLAVIGLLLSTTANEYFSRV